jgi:hypothetical protein
VHLMPGNDLTGAMEWLQELRPTRLPPQGHGHAHLLPDKSSIE